jgi:hypothetical protein
MATPKNDERKKRVKRIARAIVGTTPAARPIEPKTRRDKPKHKKPPGEEA